MNAVPKVSVIVPAYGHGGLIGETLASVFAQTFTDHEIIVINDGSPDDTAERLRPLTDAGRIRYFEQANVGQAATRNRGLAEARGEYVAFLDDDDLWPPDKLAWQSEWLDARPDVILVAGSHVLVDARGEVLESPAMKGGRLTLGRLLSGEHFTSPGQTLIRAAILREAGGFDPALWGTDDYELWLRLSQFGAMDAVPRPTLRYRVHAHNASRNAERMYWNLREVGAPFLRRLPPEDHAEVERAHYRFLYDYGVRNVFRSWMRPAPGRGWRGKWRFLRSVFASRLLRRNLFGHLGGWVRGRLPFGQSRRLAPR